MLSHIVKDRWLGLGVPIPSPITTWTPQQEWREKEVSSGCYCIPQASIVNASMAFRAFLLGLLLLCHALLWSFGNTPISKMKEKFVVKERIPSPYFGSSLLNRTRRFAFYSYVKKKKRHFLSLSTSTLCSLWRTQAYIHAVQLGDESRWQAPHCTQTVE